MAIEDLGLPGLARVRTDIGKHLFRRRTLGHTLARVRDANARETYVVECYWPSVTEQAHAAAVARARVAAKETSGNRHEVEFLGSILIPAEETVFCLFSGTEDDIREASRRAELPFERILEVERLEAGLAP